MHGLEDLRVVDREPVAPSLIPRAVTAGELRSRTHRRAPRDADRPLHDAVLAACCSAGISPTLIEMPDGHVDRILLAVAAGAGMAILPESVADRYADAGVRSPRASSIPTA